MLTAALGAAVVIFATGPRRPLPTNPRSDAPHPARTVRGAFHIHTTRSDGALDRRGVAAAAARAGLQFAIFTDHGDGTRTAEPPEYIEGVLCLDGVEISTNHGHYIALDMPASPYPLGGDADAVVEDVARLGGFGVAAHPVSARAELAWSDWSVPMDAVEWLNADSEWRDESRGDLARTLLDYVWRPGGALARLLDRPVTAIQQWDRLTRSRKVIALAGHDAHGGFGAETNGQRGRRLHLPSYETSFRTFALHAVLDGELSGQPAADARALLDAIRQGSLFTAIDAIATPAALSFSASSGKGAAKMGGTLPATRARARFAVQAAMPEGATILMFRNGDIVATGSGGELSHETADAGAYRVEIHVPGAPGTPPVPWLVSNPIFNGVTESADGAPASTTVPVVSLMPRAWRIESDPGSHGQITRDGGDVGLTYSLRSGGAASQFVALVVDLDRPSDDVAAITLRGRAAQPMRLSAQLRFGKDNDVRWRRSVFLDGAGQEVTIPLDSLRPADSQFGPRPATSRATSLLFVVDLTNAPAGGQGSFTLSEVALAR